MTQQKIVDQLTTKVFVPLVGICILLCLVAFVARGGLALAGAALGSLILLFTALTTIAMHPMLAKVSPRTAFALAFGLYWLKISLLATVLLVPGLRTLVDPLWCGIVVFSGTVWWLLMHTVVLAKSRNTLEPR